MKTGGGSQHRGLCLVIVEPICLHQMPVATDFLMATEQFGNMPVLPLIARFILAQTHIQKDQQQVSLQSLS